MEVKRIEVKNARLTDEEFLRERREVLALWPTGQELEDIREGIDYCAGLPPWRSIPRLIDRAMEVGFPLVVPRSGLPTVELQLERDTGLVKAGADIIGVVADANTQKGRYAETARVLEQRRNMPPEERLDALPIVNIGAKSLRRYSEGVGVPLRSNNGQTAPRLHAEVIFAAGFSEHLYGMYSGNLYVQKDLRPELSCKYYQYVDRLIDYYCERGWDIVRMPHGQHTVLQIPALEAASNIVEGLLFLEQQSGKDRRRYINMDVLMNGDLIQDVAACRAMPEICQEYFRKFGYTNAIVNTEACQWSGSFPQDEGRALAINSWQTAAAVWGKAVMVVVKSPQEAKGRPGLRANALGVSTACQSREFARKIPFPWEKDLEEEAEAFKRETRCIVDRMLELGDGDIAVGSIRALDSGEFDIPFMPSKYVRRRVQIGRDPRGAVRFVDPGSIPLSKECVDFNRSKLAGRYQEGFDYRAVLDDISYFIKPPVSPTAIAR